MKTYIPLKHRRFWKERLFKAAYGGYYSQCVVDLFPGLFQQYIAKEDGIMVLSWGSAHKSWANGHKSFNAVIQAQNVQLP